MPRTATKKAPKFEESEGSRMRSVFFPVDYIVNSSDELDVLRDFLEACVGDDVEVTDEEELVDERIRATFDVS